ncbi:uncharacterized protein EHS24_007679 [Apiotrichum porosum]|uniref:Uncharacterized protein n=1 Tax=Apiotrichum porosum TaxID=105984 RepID=A0A427XVC9_9TREE|nr:uncharacterized protein EHS24_007679 [Apiotrichum porosum]RSH82685.1 hypothetical protein EHS24_007679 [Apiotrichum porosum]
MQTTDTGLLFQSSQQLADASTRERKIVAAEKVGNPIKVTSKVLDLVVRGQDAWTAESGWQARRLDLNILYKGHKGPVTSVRLHQVGGQRPWLALITSSWDKTIRIWDADSGQLVHTLEAHSDFVKSTTVLPTVPPMLLSTSSDKSFRLWDLSPLTEKGIPVSRQVVKEHTRPVDSAAYALCEEEPSIMLVWTADSMGVLKEWKISHLPTGTYPLTFVRDLPGHETSIAGLARTDDGLWSTRLHGTTPVILQHPSYVKSILPNPNGLPYIVTGSEDEDIRVWDAATLDGDHNQPVAIVSGHCGEVSALVTWIKDAGGKKEVIIVSAGLDATLRRWSIDDLLNPVPLNYEPVKPNSGATMTEEEERELAELMSDED